MKIKPFAVVAALALNCASASASVSLSRDGSGQGLLFPYATVEAGQSTVLLIENPTSRAKAIKYHVRESREGHVAASGNAYVPAFGRWTVSLVDAHGDGWVALHPGTSGCSARVSDGQPEPIRLHEFPDGLPTGMDFWPVGTVTFDVVELGVLDEALTSAVAEGCSKIWSRWRTARSDPGEWTRNPADSLSVPTGGLRGTALLIDAADGTAFSYPALGFEGLSRRVRHDVLHYQTPFLDEIDAELDRYIHARLPDGRQLRFRKDRGIDAIGALLAARYARVGYSVADAIAARTEIVIAMPTRYAYVGGVIDEPYNEDSLNNDPKLVAPFTGPDCEPAAYTTRDESGKLVSEGDVPLCGPATVVRLRSDTSAANAPIVADERATVIHARGAGSIAFDFAPRASRRPSVADEEARCWQGLPVWVMALTALQSGLQGHAVAGTFPRTEVASTQYEPITCESVPGR